MCVLVLKYEIERVDEARARTQLHRAMLLQPRPLFIFRFGTHADNKLVQCVFAA